MRYSDPDLRKLNPLLRAADDGIYTLPKEILELRGGLDRLASERALRSEAGDVETIRQQLREGIRTAAIGGGDFPNGETVLSAKNAAAIRDESVRAIDEVMGGLERDLRSSIVSASDEIIIEHLRPVHDDVIAKARRCAEALSGTSNDPEALIRGSDKVRKAWVELGAVAATYSTLQTARGILAEIEAPQLDLAGEFAIMRNRRDYWVPQRPAAPWPTDDTRAMLRWLLDPDLTPAAELWFPTVSERDDLVAKRYPLIAGDYGQDSTPTPDESPAVSNGALVLTDVGAGHDDD